MLIYSDGMSHNLCSEMVQMARHPIR